MCSVHLNLVSTHIDTQISERFMGTDENIQVTSTTQNSLSPPFQCSSPLQSKDLILNVVPNKPRTWPQSVEQFRLQKALKKRLPLRQREGRF